MTWRDKLGYPVELFIGKPKTNFFRLVIHVSLKQTWQRRKQTQN